MSCCSPNVERRLLRCAAVLSVLIAAFGAQSVVADEFGPNLTVIGVTAEVQDQANSGAGVTVGIIDGLPDPSHIDLNVAALFGLVGATYTSADAHGTHVAGIVAAQRNGFGTVGVAPAATIIGLGAFDDFGWTGASTGFWLDVLRGQGGRIANMSYGPIGSGDLAFESEIYDYAAHPDILLVKAAGNSGRTLGNEICLANPAICDGASQTLANLIIVGALDASGNTIADYSNRPGESCFLAASSRRGRRGSTSCSSSNKFKNFFIVAPGTVVVSTVPGNAYAAFSGTSMATPHVTGAAALVMSLHPFLQSDPAAVAQILFRSADDLGASGVDGVYGWGRLNVAQALQPIGEVVIPTEPTVPPPRSRRPRGRRASSSTMAFSAAVSAKIASELAGRQIAVFDEFGRDFLTPLSAMVTAVDEAGDASAILADFGREPVTLTGEAGATMRLVMFNDAAAIPEEYAMPAFALVTERQSGLTAVGARLEPARFIAAAGLRPVAGGELDRPGAVGASHLGLVGEAYAAAYGSSLGAAKWTVSLFTGDGRTTADGSPRAAASGVELATGFAPFDGVHMSLQAGYVREGGGILGSVGTGFFGLTETGTAYAGLSARARLTGSLTLGTSAEFGVADARRQAYLGAGGGRLVTDAFAVWAEASNLAGKGDRLKLQISQPLRVESGALEFRIPTGRTIDGTVLWDAFDPSAAPDGRELRLDLSYATPLFDGWGDLHLGVVQRIDANHIAGNRETLALARLNRDF